MRLVFLGRIAYSLPLHDDRLRREEVEAEILPLAASGVLWVYEAAHGWVSVQFREDGMSQSVFSAGHQYHVSLGERLRRNCACAPFHPPRDTGAVSQMTPPLPGPP